MTPLLKINTLKLPGRFLVHQVKSGVTSLIVSRIVCPPQVIYESFTHFKTLRCIILSFSTPKSPFSRSEYRIETVNN